MLGDVLHRDLLNDIVIKGQQCQRNWDLSKQIPKEDLDVIIHAGTQCPSKQNLDYYSLLVIQNQEIQKEIYKNSWGGSRYNPQVLANTLFVFVPKEPTNTSRNSTVRQEIKNHQHILEIDMHQAIGVSSGFMCVISHLLGYSTGFNKCFDGKAVKEILSTDYKPILMLGVGFKDESRNRQIDHVEGVKIVSFYKINIPVTYIKGE